MSSAWSPMSAITTLLDTRRPSRQESQVSLELMFKKEKKKKNPIRTESKTTTPKGTEQSKPKKKEIETQ